MPSAKQRQRTSPRGRQQASTTLTENGTLSHEKGTIVDQENKSVRKLHRPSSISDLTKTNLDEQEGFMEPTDLEAKRVLSEPSSTLTKANSLSPLQAPPKVENSEIRVEGSLDPHLAFPMPNTTEDTLSAFPGAVRDPGKRASPPSHDENPSADTTPCDTLGRSDERDGASGIFMASSDRLENNLTREAPKAKPSKTDNSRDQKREREGGDDEKRKEEPPILSLRRIRKGKRCETIQEDHPLFIQHRELRTNSPESFPRAPYAQAKDILASLNEWRTPLEIVYARLLWKYTPEAFLSLVTRKERTREGAIQVKDELDKN